MSEQTTKLSDGSSLLCFYLNKDPFAVDLQSVREISETMPIQPVSNTVDSFIGLINLRGELIGVIDMRQRFGFPTDRTDSNAFLIFETEKGPLAALVDRLERVHVLRDQTLVQDPNIPTPVPKEYIIGVTDLGNRAVQIIDLQKIVSREELIRFKSIRSAA